MFPAISVFVLEEGITNPEVILCGVFQQQ